MIYRNIVRGHEIGSYIIRRNIVCSHVSMDKNNTNTKESKLKEYAMSSYMRYMKNYEQKLGKRFPSAMHIYRVFSEGIKGFYQDLKSFFKVRFILLGDEDKLSVLSRKQIELYHQMPKDMLKIAPVLLLSALPFANYVVFPIAYMYPDKFLTSHFWTPEQKEKIIKQEMKCRLPYNKVILKNLKSRIDYITDSYLCNKWKDVIGNLESGYHPHVEQLIECKPLFVSGPYSINSLHFGHINGLLSLHGSSAKFSKAKALEHRAIILKELDDAIIREGGLGNLTEGTIRSMCVFRGLYPINLDQEEVMSWLNKWLSLSSQIDKESYSMLLHAPFLLGCSHPNNNFILISD